MPLLVKLVEVRLGISFAEYVVHVAGICEDAVEMGEVLGLWIAFLNLLIGGDCDVQDLTSTGLADADLVHAVAVCHLDSDVE